MFDEERRRRQLHKLLDDARKLEEPYVKWGEPNLDEASGEDLNARWRVRAFEHEIDLFETEVLIALARKHGVDEPTDAASWADDSESGLSPEDVTYWLTSKGQAKLKASIREQQKKNWEFWIRLITALTGLGGALIGIISALKK
jgi:hypothetical protein